QHDERAGAPARAEHPLAERERVDVVVHEGRPAETLRELGGERVAGELGHVRHVLADPSEGRVDGPGHADPDGRDRVPAPLRVAAVPTPTSSVSRWRAYRLNATASSNTPGCAMNSEAPGGRSRSRARVVARVQYAPGPDSPKKWSGVLRPAARARARAATFWLRTGTPSRFAAARTTPLTGA